VVTGSIQSEHGTGGQTMANDHIADGRKKVRLIDANEALRMMRNSKQDNPYTGTLCGVAWELAHNCAISCVEVDSCNVDAVEVVHGRWEEIGAADYQCSRCGFRFSSADPIAMFQYCRCGAKMDGERKDNG
jgi:hypothetical protein